MANFVSVSDCVIYSMVLENSVLYSAIVGETQETQLTSSDLASYPTSLADASVTQATLEEL